jgi:hypothetical protein
MLFERISAEAAFNITMKNKVGSQPKRSSTDPRVGVMASPAFKPSFQLTAGESIFTIGSCFARGIENSLARERFEVPTMELDIPLEEIEGPNPRGALNKYTPFSMLNEVTAAFEDNDPVLNMIEIKDGLFIDIQLHSSVPVTFERAVERRKYINLVNRKAIEKSRVLVITLGLIEAWYDTLTCMYTNQTPLFPLVKRHPNRFQFEVLSVQTAIDATLSLVALLKKYGKSGQKVILTVSPVPLGRTFSGEDVLVANTYSKSVLRVAAEVAVRTFDHVDYFPSFETVLLSDPQATWMEDNVHVKPEMIHHNATRMLAAYFPKP